MSQQRVSQHQKSTKSISKQLVTIGCFTGITIGSLGGLVFLLWPDGDLSNENSSESIAAHQDSVSTQEPSAQNERSMELQNLSDTTSVEEIVYQFDRLNNEQIAELSEQTTDLEPQSKRNYIQTILVGELSRRDPKRALEQVWTFPRPQWNELVAIVFSEWSLNSVEESFTASMELDTTLCETAVRSLLNTRTQLSNERWLTLATEHDYQESMLKLLREREAIALLDTPMDAFHQVIHDDVDDQLQRDLIEKIARTMVQKHGYESFDALFEFSIWWFQDLLMEEAESNPADFFSVVQTLPPDSRNSVIFPLVDAWVPLDPSAAYEAISTLEEFKERSYYYQIFRKWAEVNPEELLSRVESFPRSERQAAVNSGIGELAMNSPEEAAKRTFEFDSVIGIDVSDLQERVIRQWAASDPNATLNWVIENTAEDSSEQAWLLYTGLRELVKTDPEAALELALTQAPESVYAERGYAESVVGDVVEAGELELAMDAMDRIPENARVYSFTVIGRALALENRWQEAIELIDVFSEEDQVRFFDDLTYFTMRDDVVNVLETLPKLPSERVRRQVAQSILTNQERSGDFLTAEQVKYMQQFVTPNENEEASDNISN